MNKQTLELLRFKLDVNYELPAVQIRKGVN
jgi:hypothetical protein